MENLLQVECSQLEKNALGSFGKKTVRFKIDKRHQYQLHLVAFSNYKDYKRNVPLVEIFPQLAVVVCFEAQKTGIWMLEIVFQTEKKQTFELKINCNTFLSFRETGKFCAGKMFFFPNSLKTNEKEIFCFFPENTNVRKQSMQES